jgi:CubicO group peptidase (beta-lactamase class C family)
MHEYISVKALALLSLLSILLCAVGQKSKAESRLDEFLAAFNSKDAAKIRAMCRSSFAKGMFSNRSEDQWVAQTMQIADNLAPLTVEKKLLDKDNRIVVSTKTAKGMAMGFMLIVESTEPFGIAGIQISPDVDSLLNPVKQPILGGYATLHDLATKVVKELGVPAIAVAEWKNGKMKADVAGVRKVGEPALATVDDRWLIGSNTKSMTATLIATFIAEKKLDWNSKLGEVLKDIPMKAGYRDATLEQVMQHMGGIPQDMNFTGERVNQIVGTLTDPQSIRIAYAKDILSRELIAKPGERFAYSNAGYALLSVIAERVGKKPFPQLMEERVFKPLGLDSAICGMPGVDDQPSGKGQPSGHFAMQDGPRPGKLGGPLTYMCQGAGAGVSCSITDLAKYVAWHMRGYSGEKVPGLSSDLIRRLHTPLPRKPGVEQYAAGWVIDDRTDSPMHEHAGSDGTFMAEMAFWPSKKFAAVAITNVGGEQNPSPALQAMLAMYRTDGKKP